MNGRFDRPNGTHTRQGSVKLRSHSMNERPASIEWRRLSAAVLLSVLLHTALLGLGASARQPGTATPTPAGSPAMLVRLSSPEPGATPTSAAARPMTGAAPQASAQQRPVAQAPHQPLLNRKARPLDPIRLDIPEAQLPDVQGRLVIKLWIDPQGRVVAYEPEPTALPTEYVTAVAETLLGVRFAPAMEQGQAVPGTYRIEIQAEDTDAPQQ